MLALRTLFRDVERGEYCLLSKRMLASFGIEPKGYLRGKLSDHLYGENTLSRREIAQFSLMVKDCAYEGCEVSLAIYDDCAYRLAELADIAYRRAIGSGDCPVALVGGLKKAGEILIEPFKKHLSAFSERLVYTEPAFDNFIGSVVVVLKEIGVALDEERLQNIRISQNKVE